ncbi:uncharacterized protein LOC119452590 isoform X2 [Dermacentor silvarum]|uniref:uncharacterized protein LOC119452590 isoform X2 n=1 Tax=Dermacentor silvarum TaxID=543639 RepID=UPI002100831C|nr:uncharacterized protein LOC119452590 isoform X2 [Dermacentor silvarum]
MNVHYSHLYFICLWTTFCFGTKQEGIIKPSQYNVRENDVKKLLSGPHHLIISRAIYERPDYPLCVRSHFISLSDVGFRHKLSYKEKDFKGPRIRGIRQYRNAYYHVQKLKTVFLFVANAFKDTHQVDPRVSGSYNIYYANEICFIAGTHLPGNAACLLWRLARAKEHERISCRAAFRRFCSRSLGHKVYYTKETCGSQNDRNETSPVGAKLN